MRLGLVLVHPLVAFLFAWLFTLSLCELSYIDSFTSELANVESLIPVVVIPFALGAFLVALLTSFARRPTYAPNTTYIKVRHLKLIFLIWSAITVFEICWTHGLPIYWLIVGNGKTEDEFGIHTLHGFANTLWLYLATGAFIANMAGPVKPPRWLMFLLYSWPILTLSRALATIFLLMAAMIYIGWRSPSARRLLLSAFVATVLFILVFGFAGDVRNTDFSVHRAISSDKLQDWNSGVVWVYVYLVSPISNLALNIEHGNAEFNWVPLRFLTPMVPSVILNQMGIDTSFRGSLGELVNPAFNVGTAFLGIYFDWGVSGILLFSFSLGAIGHYIWIQAMRRPTMLVIVAGYSACCALTVFTNQFNQLTIVLLFACWYGWVRSSRQVYTLRRLGIGRRTKTNTVRRGARMSPVE